MVLRGLLFEAAERHGLDVGLLLLTHHHMDHVAENDVWKVRHGVEIVAHPLEAARLLDVDRTIEPGETVEAGDLRIEPCTPRGTPTACSTSWSAGRCSQATPSSRARWAACAPRAGRGSADLKRSIMDVLMALPPETVVRPGHTDPTTIGDEWENDAFVRVWRGLDSESADRCRVGEDEATLVLWAPDYDGGHKAWVRWDDGRDDIVPGSTVSRD